MLRTLRNLVVNIMAACIRDRDARHKFRNKYKRKSKFRKLRDDNRRLFNENKQIRAELNRIKTSIIRLNEKNYFRFNNKLVKLYRDFIEIPDMPEKYKKLIEGLDDESIMCVSEILSRMKLISKQGFPTDSTICGAIDLYSQREIEQLEKIRKEFTQQIIQLSNDCYAYKQYMLPIKHFESSVFYYKHQIPNLNNITKLNNKDFIDVGGFIGDSALVFTEYTDGKIYSFEAVKNNFENMLKTIELNNLKNVIPINYGLGSKDEILKIITGKNSGGSGCRIDKNQDSIESNYEEAHITTLDKFCFDKDLDIGLIKVDIEGFEQEFLIGAEQTIRKYRPTLLISIYHNPSDFFDIKPMIESWDLGYTLKISHPINGSIRSETLLICECNLQK